MADTIRVTVWNEFVHEKKHEAVQKVYPNGIHNVIAESLQKQPGLEVRTATLDQPEHGLTDEVLQATDVMVWWGHMAHDQVSDAVAQKVQKRVLEGMGFIALHSGHYSKPFRLLMGTACTVNWREVAEREILWVCHPGHPIAEGIDPCLVLEHTEMYGEPFGIPVPDEQVFISSFAGGEVFRSGNVWHRGAGKVFYFRPGHETYPIFYNESVMRVIANGVRYVRPTHPPIKDAMPNRKMGWWEEQASR